MPKIRSESDIIKSILDIASEDDDVRAVVRTDLLPVRKYLYTYNFCFIVSNIDKYDRDVFGSCLGDRILLYRSDKNYPEMFPDTKAHLMVFRDGITIVIQAMYKAAFLSRYCGEKEYENVWIGDTYQKILDKDDLLPVTGQFEEKQTIFAGSPTEEEFTGTCSEFWWVLKTFAEYTLREELPSAMFYLNIAVRDLLNKMLRWHIFLRAGQPVDMGILDSRLEKVLEKEYFLLYRKTYPDADYNHIWEAYDAVVELWNKAGTTVADQCGFTYPHDTEKNMLEFIQGLRES
ncbi:MAG: aminoglycoside 6-adenylyltransferase [Parasporobacterium sp.]|nr:aminoglycoside 6-adenylyltransferase [Parasporobacterium sp.]